MEDTIQCIKRIYRIQTSTGVKMDVERNEPLSEAATAMLLDEDHEIKSFLGKCNILSVEIPENVLITKHAHKAKKKKILKRIRHKESRDKGKQPDDTGKTIAEEEQEIKPEEQEIKPEEQEIKPEEQEITENHPNVEMAKSANRLSPCDRINMMITMEGEFIRKDYMKFMEDKNYKMTDFMGYGDIEEALLLRKIELTGEKVGKGFRKYRIIDTRPVEQYTYRKMKQSRKEKRKYR